MRIGWSKGSWSSRCEYGAEFPSAFCNADQVIVEAKKEFDNKGITFSLEDHWALADKSLEELTEATKMEDEYKYQFVLQLPGLEWRW